MFSSSSALFLSLNLIFESRSCYASRFTSCIFIFKYLFKCLLIAFGMLFFSFSALCFCGCHHYSNRCRSQSEEQVLGSSNACKRGSRSSGMTGLFCFSVSYDGGALLGLLPFLVFVSSSVSHGLV